MAIKRTKKKFTIKFELGFGGLFSVGIVVFCVFLWMFLFGVWTGQTLLEPSGQHKDGIAGFALNLWKQKSPALIEEQNSDPEFEKETKEPLQRAQKEEGPAHFSLQVAAFRDAENARKIVLQWRARDFESFYLAPEQPDGTFYRVFVGVFNEMAEAKKMVAALEGKDKEKYFITLLPVTEKRYP